LKKIAPAAWLGRLLRWNPAALHRAFGAILVGCVLLSGSCATAPSAPRAEILWDEWGVPHIFARSDNDLFYALGWASMQNHAPLMLRHYGEARGRAAEYWGEAHLESDVQIRTLRIPARAEQWLGLQTPDFRAKLDAFVAGVNAYAAANPEAIPEDVRVVLPVRTVDLLMHQQRSGVLPFAFADLASTVQQWAAAERGSNAWAIGPEHSASGAAMLLMNPHIPWGEEVFGGLFRVFEVDLHAPGFQFYGGLQVGSPFPAGGFSERHAISGTVNTLDDVDTYELTLADGGYMLDGVRREFETEHAQILVREDGGRLAPHTTTIRWSVHGPVIAERAGHALAVRLAGIDMPRQYQQYWEMARARSFEEFEAAVRLMQMPKSNLLYADREGNIYYLAAGAIPARASGDYEFWRGIVPGDTSQTLWTDTLPYEGLPRALNPPAHWLQNANDPPWSVTSPAAFSPAQFPPWMSPQTMSFRAQRSMRMITQADRITFEAFRDSKLSTRSELADRILDDLIAAARARGRAREAVAVLEAWDHEARAESRGAVLFFAWARLFQREQHRFATPWSAAAPLATPDGLADPARAVALLEQAAAETRAAYGQLDVPFGEVYRLRWPGGIDLPGHGASGQYGVFRVTDYLPTQDGRYRAFQGDSFVALVEFSDPLRAEVLLSYGNASIPGSPHNGDQLRLYSQGQLRTAWRTREAIAPHLASREVLQ